jgi:O-antigen/teichoic acid export membrane protein
VRRRLRRGWPHDRGATGPKHLAKRRRKPAPKHLAKRRRKSAPRWQSPHLTAIAWGFVSQAAYSANNFGLSVLAARAAGPSGLGSVFAGFSAYLIALGFQRSLFTDPLVAVSTRLHPEARLAATRATLSLGLLYGLGVSALLLVAGSLLPGGAGDGLVFVAPWAVPALFRDVWRVVLFREQRGGAAALNDCTCLLVMLACAPLALAVHSAALALACWGVGAVAGSLLGFLQCRYGPARLAVSLSWWRAEAWTLGRLLGSASLIYTLGSQTLVFVLALLVGTRDLGGLRAVQSVFAPLTMLGPALALPGLPAVARRLRAGRSAALSLSMRISLLCFLLTAGYVIFAAVLGTGLLASVFGSDFAGFDGLVWPVAIGQLAIAPVLGFSMLLTAERRGGAVVVAETAAAVVTLGLGTALALRDGITGAAWAHALASAVGGTVILVRAMDAPSGRVAVDQEHSAESRRERVMQ